MDEVDQVAEVPLQPVEFPDDQGVPVAQGFEVGGQLGPIILLPGGLVFVEGIPVDADSRKNIPLKVRRLGAIRLETRMYPTRTDFSSVIYTCQAPLIILS